MRRPFESSHFLLLLRRDDCHDEIHQQHRAVEGEESQHEQQADDGGVNVEIVAETRAHACDHAVGFAPRESFVIGHVSSFRFVHLLYAGIRKGLRVICIFVLRDNWRLLRTVERFPAR